MNTYRIVQPSGDEFLVEGTRVRYMEDGTRIIYKSDLNHEKDVVGIVPNNYLIFMESVGKQDEDDTR